MHAFKDSMWRGMWKILQNFLQTKLGLSEAACISTYGVLYSSNVFYLLNFVVIFRSKKNFVAIFRFPAERQKMGGDQ
jgi:hypothetical protein